MPVSSDKLSNMLYALMGTLIGGAAVLWAVLARQDAADASPRAGSGGASAVVSPSEIQQNLDTFPRAAGPSSRAVSRTGSGVPQGSPGDLVPGRGEPRVMPGSVHRAMGTGDLEGAVQETRDSVVMLDVLGNLSGAGVVIDGRGVVLTNYHVVAPLFGPSGRFSSREGGLRVRFRDGRTLRAEVVAADGTEDLALLQLQLPEGESVRWAAMGRSEALEVGASVFAVGCPVGLEHTVSSGIVSAVNRAGVLSNPDVPVIQLGASINLGDSGGPLFSLEGELIGITTARAKEAQGIAFAIPIDRIRSFLEALDSGTSSQLGYVGLELRPDLSVAAELGGQSFVSGVRVGAVPEDGPAAAAGVRDGDVVVALRGRRFDEFGSGAAGRFGAARSIQKAARALLAGERLELTVLRDGVAREVVLEARNVANDRPFMLKTAAALLGIRFDASDTVARVEALVPEGALARLQGSAKLKGARVVRVLGRPTERLDDVLALVPGLIELAESGRGRRIHVVFETREGQLLAADIPVAGRGRGRGRG